MNGMKTEEAGSRKKYLAPLIVIMLCLVALTGAAYAYASTLTNSQNTVEAKDLTLDLATGTIASDVTTGANIVTFTDNYDYAVVDSVQTKSNTIKYELQDNITIAVYKIKVTGTADFDTFTLSSTTTGKTLEGLKPFDSLATGELKSKTLGDLYDFKYVIGTTGTGEGLANVLGVTDLGDSGTVTMSKNTTYYVTLTATLAAGVVAEDTVETVSPASPGNSAHTYQNAFNGSKFTLELEVTKA